MLADQLPAADGDNAFRHSRIVFIDADGTMKENNKQVRSFGPATAADISFHM
jgi:hypothetical protein